MLKKEQRGTGLRGQLERGVGSPGQGRGRRARPSLQPSSATPLSARAAAFEIPGVRTRSGGRVRATTPTPPPCYGGVARREGGFKSPRVSDPSDRSPNSSLSPAARFRAPGWHATLPRTPRRLGRLPGDLGSPVSPKPHTRRTHQASDPHRWLLFELLALEPTPLSPAPASRSSQLLARRTPNSEVRGMGTVCRDLSEAQPLDLTSPYSRDWDLEALPLPRGMRRARACAGSGDSQKRAQKGASAHSLLQINCLVTC